MAFALHGSIGGINGRVTSILQKRQQNKRAPKVMLEIVGASLPHQLMLEILSWLPVKCLVKFMVVCKSWYSIIRDDPYFVSKHMQNYYKNNDEFRGCLFAQFMVTQAGELDEYELLLDDETQRVLAFKIIKTPECHDTYLCGPCDGLYYLWCILGNYVVNSRFMWNPALNQFKVLPPLISNPNYPPHIVFAFRESYGFGYDPCTKDYKVIIAKGFRDTTKDNDYYVSIDYPLSVFIYSLKDDSWRYWGDMEKYYYLKRNICYVFANNSVYWLGSTDPDYNGDLDMIIAFNLATE